MPDVRHRPIPAQEAPLPSIPPAEVAQFLPAALRFAHKLLPQDAAEADDVAQDVMLAYLRKAPAIPRDSVLGWLYRATQFEVKQRKRHFRRKEGWLARLRGSLLHTLHESPSREGGALLTDLRQALIGLTKYQVAILELWAHGYDYQEIARIRHVSVNTVKDHLKKALAAIRRAITSDMTGATHGY